MHAQSDEYLLSTREAADYLQNSPRTFVRWRGLGIGPAYIRAGGKIRYQRRDLEEWLARHRVHPVREYTPAESGIRGHRRAGPSGRTQ